MAKIFRLAERRWVRLRAEHARSRLAHPAGRARTARPRVRPAPPDPTPNDAA